MCQISMNKPTANTPPFLLLYSNVQVENTPHLLDFNAEDKVAPEPHCLVPDNPGRSIEATMVSPDGEGTAEERARVRDCLC